MTCDLCGKNGELYRAVIEDVELNVCSSCSSYGKIVGKIPFKKDASTQVYSAKKQEQKENIEMIVGEYPSIIKKSRESLGMTQKEFSLKINEKESLMHKIETGSIEPSIHLARKLEKALKVKLVESYAEQHETISTAKSESYTLGDFIKLKK